METQYMPMFDITRHPINDTTLPLIEQRILCEICWLEMFMSNEPNQKFLQEFYNIARNIDQDLELTSALHS